MAVAARNTLVGVVSVMTLCWLGAGNASAQNVIGGSGASGYDFSGAPWNTLVTTAAPGGTALVVNSAGTGWSSNVGGDAFSNNGNGIATEHSPMPRFPTNDGFVFGGTGAYPNPDTNASSYATAGSHAFGYYVGAVGDSRQVSYTGTNNTGRTVYAYALEYRAQVWNAGIDARNGQITGAQLNGVTIPSSTSNVFLVSNHPGDYTAATGQQFTDFNALNGRFIDGTLAQNSQLVHSSVLQVGGTSGQANGAAVSLLFNPLPGGSVNGNLTAGGTTSFSNKNVGLGVTNVKLVALYAGDANGDFSVGTSDISAIVGAGKYNTGAAAVWADGDFNNDGVVSTADISAIIGDGKYQTGAYAVSSKTGSGPRALAITSPGAHGDNKVSFSYNPTTGDVKLDSDGIGNAAGPGALQVIHLLSATGQFNTANSTLGGGPFDIDTTNEQYGARFGVSGANSFYPDGYDLGNILPAGLTLPSLLTDLTLTYNTNGGGSAEKAADIFSLPEPTGLGLLVIGAIGLMARRRRNTFNA